ncbi:hypothetical protein GCK32_012791 [Trichostrongylus colubriformis]|uniref:Uncharacterized protein n=1 Tax=Trichostrongylus colubriformis TaxID=6319 RepID=A0AAN8IFG1_TRICO
MLSYFIEITVIRNAQENTIQHLFRWSPRPKPFGKVSIRFRRLRRDNGNSDEQHAGALKAKEEVPDSAKSLGQEQTVVIESNELPTATVSPLTPEDERKEVEEEEVEVERPREQPKKKHDHKSPYGSLLNWMDQNPNAVRCAATAAAVAGLAGLGAFVYARKVGSGGV